MTTDALHVCDTGHASLAHWDSNTQSLLFPVSFFSVPTQTVTGNSIHHIGNTGLSKSIFA